jgi:hypothetical protein
VATFKGFSPNYYFNQQSAGLGIWVASGSINGILFNGKFVSVPANAITNISLDSNGNVVYGIGSGLTSIARVVSGQVQTSGTPNTSPVFSNGILSITYLRTFT